MKNRNTKDVAENHIYPFIISNFALFAGIFFSLNSAHEAALLLYALALNLFSNWLGFYSFRKKKLVHFSEYYNNLSIGIFSVAAVLSVLLLIIPLVLFPSISKSLLLISSLILAIIFNKLILLRYKWQRNAEQILSKYKMNIEEEKEDAFAELKEFIKLSGKQKFADYIEKNQIFDQRVEEYIKK